MWPQTQNSRGAYAKMNTKENTVTTLVKTIFIENVSDLSACPLSFLQYIFYNPCPLLERRSIFYF